MIAQPTPEVPPVANCAYQVKIDYRVYQCMTAQEYKEYSDPQQLGVTGNTPWIVLAILIALAVLATSAYFFWFNHNE